MYKKKRILLVLQIIFIIILSNLVLAQTTCQTEDCKITITIKIAFAGATDQQIDAWANDIDDVWNGPNGYQTTGDCNCLVKFKVETMKITNASQINCNPPPAGYHCVMVTPWNNDPAKLPFFYNASNQKEYVVGYMGYNTQSPSQGGASLDGWWSDQMNNPSPDGENYHDAAHEAGHMMGLGDKEGDGLMTHTSGDKAKPTQANIDSVVANVCGPNACPDSCCCGNGLIEGDKGEGCDPFADPVGCSAGENCCPGCCQCFRPSCNPANGEFLTQQDCQNSCQPATSSKCYFNYKTGCWDCLKDTTVTSNDPAPYDPAALMEDRPGCVHPPPLIFDFDPNDLLGMTPLESIPLAGIFADERINIYVDDQVASVVFEEGVIKQASFSELEDPTMHMFTSMETINRIASRELSFSEAMINDDIQYEGVGFINSGKELLVDVGFWFYSFFD